MAVVVPVEGQLSPFLRRSPPTSPAPLMLGAPSNTPMDVSMLSRSQESDLTSLNWLHKPDVLNVVCAPLIHVTGEERGLVKSKRAGSDRSAGSMKIRDTDKVLDVILNVRVPRVSAPDANKPQLSFACMIFMAIESSPSRMLPVRDIYSWIMHKFPFYKGAPSGWKNSVRHNLSLNKCFCKVEKSKLPRGMYMPKGSYWTVDRRYRQSLLAALKRTPFHPYHKYFPLSLLEEKTAGLEDNAAEIMCSLNQPPVTPVTLHAIEVDHSYAQPLRSRARSTAVDIAEEAAIAHVEAELKRLEDKPVESDQAYESSEEMELVEELSAGAVQSTLNDSGYSEAGSTMGDLDGANALLHLANSPVVTPPKHTRNKRRSRR